MRSKEDFKSEVNLILVTFLSLLKSSNIGLAVNTHGSFIFFDQTTGNELYILKDDLVEFYEEI